MANVLGYSHEPNRKRRKRLIRIAFGVVLLILATFLFLQLPRVFTAWNRYKLQSVLNRPLPTSQPVRRETGITRDKSGREVDRQFVRSTRKDWADFLKVALPQHLTPAFVGLLKRDDADERLVVISLLNRYTLTGPALPTGTSHIALQTRVANPCTIASPPSLIALPTYSVVCMPGETLNTVCAGSLVAESSDTFMIPYQCGDAVGTIEGVLQADNSIRWRVLSGPASIHENQEVEPR